MSLYWSLRSSEERAASIFKVEEPLKFSKVTDCWPRTDILHDCIQTATEATQPPVYWALHQQSLRISLAPLLSPQWHISVQRLLPVRLLSLWDWQYLLICWIGGNTWPTRGGPQILHWTWNWEQTTLNRISVMKWNKELDASGLELYLLVRFLLAMSYLVTQILIVTYLVS